MSVATDMLQLYIDAETKLLTTGKMVMMGGRQWTTENLSELRKGRQEWQSKVDAENAKLKGGSTTYSVATWS